MQANDAQRTGYGDHVAGVPVAAVTVRHEDWLLVVRCDGAGDGLDLCPGSPGDWLVKRVGYDGELLIFCGTLDVAVDETDPPVPAPSSDA